MPLFIERRNRDRTRHTVPWDFIYQGLRGAATHADTFITALGVFLVAGLAAAAAGTWAFSELAEHVMAGQTQAFDDLVIAWMGAHRSPLLEDMMLELTSLGTGAAVTTVVAVATLFLSLTKHKYSAFLLIVSTVGGLGLNIILKMYFQRPRPSGLVWAANAGGTLFPSGHAMSAAIAYGTVAYLAARLHPHLWARVTTMTVAICLILAIAVSRVYLGVHYPSDVVAGMTIGLTWASFCMATLEALQRFAIRNAPQVLADETPAPPHDG